LDAAEQEPGGNDVPGVLRDDAGGEEVQLFEAVGLA